MRNTGSITPSPRITRRISEKSIQLVRYYGWFNRQRGKRAQQQQKKITGSSRQVAELTENGIDTSSKNSIVDLARIIKKVWEVDPFSCSWCGGELHIISFIDEA